MAEGDTIHRTAARLREALGESPLRDALAPSPQSPLRRQPDRLAALLGRRLERAEARGKHLLLGFEGELTLHCHQGMRGAWHTYAPSQRWRRPRQSAWVVLSTASIDAAEFGGTRMALRSAAELRRDPVLRGLGPDVLGDGFRIEEGIEALRRRPGARPLGEALLDQRAIAGIGNVFKSEACWEAGVNPWRSVDALGDEELADVVRACERMMRPAVVSGRRPRRVYRLAGRLCPRCGGPICSRGQGDANRATYWCPACQA